MDTNAIILLTLDLATLVVLLVVLRPVRRWRK